MEPEQLGTRVYDEKTGTWLYPFNPKMMKVPFNLADGVADAFSSQLVNNPNPVILDGVRTGGKEQYRPILYYRARPTQTRVACTSASNYGIYNYTDNMYITTPFGMSGQDYSNGYSGSYGDLLSFPYYVWDRSTGAGNTPQDWFNSASARPYCRDSFMLISAGSDGQYGTDDDICNFDN